MIYVVMKRFIMDDVPVFATTDREKAYVRAGVYANGIGKKATAHDNRISPCDIGTTCVSVSVVTFGNRGFVTRSEVVAV
jgi:hypothetical protein